MATLKLVHRLPAASFAAPTRQRPARLTHSRAFGVLHLVQALYIPLAARMESTFAAQALLVRYSLQSSAVLSLPS